jgi:hypothetical protein
MVHADQRGLCVDAHVHVRTQDQWGAWAHGVRMGAWAHATATIT